MLVRYLRIRSSISKTLRDILVHQKFDNLENLNHFVSLGSRPDLRVISLVWLLAVILGASAHSPASQLRANEGLVYCPLQMQWVAKLKPKPVESRERLSEVCADDGYKNLFLEKAALFAPSIQRTSDTNELFFTFVSKGERVFKDLPTAPGRPNEPAQVVETTQSSAVSGQSSFAAVTTQYFSFEQLSRPPTEPQARNFSSRFIVELQSPDFAIPARGPPSSCSNNRLV